MVNHPNRPRAGPSPARNPSPEEVRAARTGAGLTERAAAELIHCSLNAWHQWEEGLRRMHPAFWELFTRKLTERAGTGDGDQAGAEA